MQFTYTAVCRYEQIFNGENSVCILYLNINIAGVEKCYAIGVLCLYGSKMFLGELKIFWGSFALHITVMYFIAHDAHRSRFIVNTCLLFSRPDFGHYLAGLASVHWKSAERGYSVRAEPNCHRPSTSLERFVQYNILRHTIVYVHSIPIVIVSYSTESDGRENIKFIYYIL